MSNNNQINFLSNQKKESRRFGSLIYLFGREKDKMGFGLTSLLHLVVLINPRECALHHTPWPHFALPCCFALKIAYPLPSCTPLIAVHIILLGSFRVDALSPYVLFLVIVPSLRTYICLRMLIADGGFSFACIEFVASIE